MASAVRRTQSKDESESYVKGWQLEMTNQKLDSVLSSVLAIQQQLSDLAKLAQDRPTKTEVDALIVASESRNREELKNAIEKQDLKYSPIVGNNKWLLRFLVGIGTTLLLSLGTILIGLITK